jgi:hypothetical protein
VYDLFRRLSKLGQMLSAQTFALYAGKQKALEAKIADLVLIVESPKPS